MSPNPSRTTWPTDSNSANPTAFSARTGVRVRGVHVQPLIITVHRHPSRQCEDLIFEGSVGSAARLALKQGFLRRERGGKSLPCPGAQHRRCRSHSEQRSILQGRPDTSDTRSPGTSAPADFSPPGLRHGEGNGFVHFAVSHFGGSPLASELLMSLALVACGIGRRQHRRDEKQDYGLRAPHTGVKQPGQFRTASVPFTFCVSGCSN